MGGIELIHTLRNLGATIRTEIDHYHDQWFQQAISLAAKVGVEESIPRRASKQTMRDNYPADNASDYYKRGITAKVVDHFNTELESRFYFDSINVYNGLCIVPTKMKSLISKNIDWKEKFTIFSSFYYDDFPNPLALDAELVLGKPSRTLSRQCG